MKFKIREIAKKFKYAFKKARIDLPAKKEKPVKNKKDKSRNSSRSVKVKPLLVAASHSSRSTEDDKSSPTKTRNLKKTTQKKNAKRQRIQKTHFDGLPSYSAIQKAYGSSQKSRKTSSGDISSQSLTQTALRAREGIKFKPNPVFEQKMVDSRLILIDEGPCAIQLSQKSDIEVQLVIGLDLGTSTTKVVIGDPDRKRFYAVPFSPESSNPYLVPTAIQADDEKRVVIKTGDGPGFFHNIKLDLMQRESRAPTVLVAGYIAQIIRHSIRWFLSAHADEYRDMEIFWTMALGLPTDSARQEELEHRFRLAAITGAQAAISQEDSITIGKVGELKSWVEKDLITISANGGHSRFEELGSDAGVVEVVPEIAAQVVGLYRSRRWDSKKPISFLMDIGAGTVDSAVFSLVDASQEDKELAFCCFSCDVSELGVVKLHRDRVDWLIKNLPEDIPDREKVVEFLVDQQQFDETSTPIPVSIDEYINHIEIVSGDTNKNPDSEYKEQLAKKIHRRVLQGAKRKNESDSAWDNLRAMICGGGARSDFYRKFVQNISKNTSFNLQIEALEKPSNLEAPGLPSSEYDRLSVAYGLAQGTQWKYRWPESIEDIGYRKRDSRGTYISKDMV